MDIYFTKHARQKFKVLSRHGVVISESKVKRTVSKPTTIDKSRLPLLIAQDNLDATHVIRVAYRKEGDLVIIITFYPGRKPQYEK
jgi:hypothetical protein